MAPIRPTNPLDWRVPIVNTNGTPTPEFQRRWATQALLNNVIVDLSTAANVSGVLDLLGTADGSILVRGTSLWGAHTLTGDATLSDVGLLTVTGLQGRLVSATAPASGQVLEWSGTAWTPATLPPQDVIIGAGAPSALEPAGVLYSQSDTDALWSSQPVALMSAVKQSATLYGAFSPATVTLGSNPAVGNLLIVFVHSWFNSSIDAAKWTLLDSNVSDSQGAIQVVYRYAQAGDVAALPALTTGSPSTWVVSAFEISGISGTVGSDIVAHSVAIDAGTSPLASASLTTTAAHQLVLLGFSDLNGNASPVAAPPVGWTSDHTGQGTSGATMTWLSAHLAVASSGTVVTPSATFSQGAGTAKSTIGAVLLGSSGATANWDFIAPTAGPAGPQGVPGLPGADGQDGLDGDRGAPGPTGVAGAQGVAGPTGAAGSVGPPGQDGQDGADADERPPGLTRPLTAADVGLGNVTNNTQTNASVVPNVAPTNGQILVGSTGLSAYAPKSMSGDATLATGGALTLVATAVSAGPYGDSLRYPSFTVDAKGRLTAAGSLTIPLTASGQDGQDGADASDRPPGLTRPLFDTEILGTTPNTIPFVSASGFFVESAALTFNPTTQNFAFGDSTIANGLQINSLSGVFSLVNSGSIFQRITANNAAPAFSFQKARGTGVSSPAVIVTGDSMINFRALGYDGVSTYRLSASILANVIEPTPGPTAMGGQLVFSTAALGTVGVVEVARLESGTGFSLFGANPVIDQNRIHRMRVFATLAALQALVTSPVEGMRAFIQDNLVGTFGSAATGGGTNHVPVYYNGATAAWMVG